MRKEFENDLKNIINDKRTKEILKLIKEDRERFKKEYYLKSNYPFLTTSLREVIVENDYNYGVKNGEKD